eukprot:scaffold3283_cov237-Pinguiococcus_pyrenoidosus.AAC.5
MSSEIARASCAAAARSLASGARATACRAQRLPPAALPWTTTRLPPTRCAGRLPGCQPTSFAAAIGGRHRIRTAADELGARQVVQRQLVTEEASNARDLIRIEVRSVSRFFHELRALRGQRVLLVGVRVGFLLLLRHLGQGVGKEAGERDPRLHLTAHLLLLLEVVLKRAGQHVREEAERNGEKKLHEGHDDEEAQRHETEDIRHGAE